MDRRRRRPTTTVRQTPLTARLSPGASSARESRAARRSRMPAGVGLTSATSPSASIRPVNIQSLDQHVVAERHAPLTSVERRDGAVAAAPATARPPAPSAVRRHEHLRRDRRGPRPRTRACSVGPPSTMSDERRRAAASARQRLARNASAVAGVQRISTLAPRPPRSASAATACSAAVARCHDYDRPGVERREHPRRRRRAQAAVEDDADSGRCAIGAARRQQRIVDEDRLGPDRDRVDLGALPMDQRGWPRRRSAASARPRRAATMPSRLSATFSVTNGRPRRMHA